MGDGAMYRRSVFLCDIYRHQHLTSIPAAAHPNRCDLVIGAGRSSNVLLLPAGPFSTRLVEAYMKNFLLRIIHDDNANDVFNCIMGSLFICCLLLLAIIATEMP